MLAMLRYYYLHSHLIPRALNPIPSSLPVPSSQAQAPQPRPPLAASDKPGSGLSCGASYQWSLPIEPARRLLFALDFLSLNVFFHNIMMHCSISINQGVKMTYNTFKARQSLVMCKNVLWATGLPRCWITPSGPPCCHVGCVAWGWGGGSREMGHEGRCNVHLGGLDGGVGRKLAVSEVRMGERHLCHAIGCSWPAALRPPPSNRLLVTSWGKWTHYSHHHERGWVGLWSSGR